MSTSNDTNPRNGVPPESIALKVVKLKEVTSFPVERHTWGQFVYSVAGTIELTISSSRYAAPRDFGVWLPPQTDHFAWAGDDTSYFLLDIDAQLCDSFPSTARILAVSPIAKAILLDLKIRGIRNPQNAADERLMSVLIDQLSIGSPLESFLPLSNDPALKQVLEELSKNPGDRRTLEEWAWQVHCTERTLARRCKRDLGMSFVEWRQRLRLSRALTMLSDGLAVQTVAQKLGYSTTSAFIVMFQREIGATPNAFRGRTKDGERALS